jgi:gliding motility-associated-like protein
MSLRCFLSAARAYFHKAAIVKYKQWLPVIAVACCLQVSGQDFSNKGKDFWVGYGSHVSMYNSNGSVNGSGGSQDMVLYFTSDQNATVTVSIPRLSWTRTYNVVANTVTESDRMPKSAPYDARLSAEGISDAGIHITSTNPVVAYAHIYASSVSGASLLFPTPTLGRDYYVLGFTQVSNSAYSYPFCFVIATEDNTTVEVTPSVSTQGHAAGVPFTEVLQQGQVLNLLGVLTGNSGNRYTGVDLTGTRIRTISNGQGGCTKIAVYCGSGKLNIQCNTSGTASADNTFQQIFPFTAWGKKYITVPTRNMPANFFRVMVTDPATIVSLNGTPLTGLVNNNYYQFSLNTPGIIESDMPVLVAQFVTTATQCGNTAINNNGDPEMIYLSPVEQTISKITLNSTSHFDITSHFVNVVLKTGGIPSFRLDGAASANGFTPLPQDPAYAYAQFPVSAGIHSLQSDSGFNAIAYGYGNAESYGYNAGTNVIDLYQYISVQNQYLKTNVPATCEKSPFHLSITLPYIPLSMTWDFGNNATITPHDAVSVNSPVPDSSFQKNDKTLYVFRLPDSYVFDKTGTYPLKVTVNNPSADGCSGIQEIEFDMQVYDKPVADWQSTQTGCFTDSVHFTATSSTGGRPVARYNWNFGDGTLDSIAAPAKKYAAGGSYPVKLQVVTDIGCIGETTTKPIILSAVPVAAFVTGDTTCAGHAVVYTDRSTIAQGGTLAWWYWDDGNGHKDTLQQGLPREPLYSNAGTYSPSLQVVSTTGCVSPRVPKTVTIGTYPLVNFILPEICVSDVSAPFIDSSFNADHSALSYQWNFGDPNASLQNPDNATQKNASHHYSAAMVYSVTETVTSAHNCATSLTKAFTVNGAVPVAAFSVENAGALCSNQAVKVQNRSTVDFGSVSRVLLYWDAVSEPDQANKDENPYSGKIYSRQYTKSSQPQSYRIRLQAYSGGSCMSEVSQVVNLHASPTVSFTPPPAYCDGDKAFQVTTAIETGQVPGRFSYSGKGISATGLFSPAISHTGLFPVQARYTSNEGCKDSASASVRVWPVPVLQPMPATTVLEGSFTLLKPLYKAIHPSFLWTPAQYLNNDTIANPAASPADDQQYTLTITEAGGCTVSGTVLVKVLKNLLVANVFSPNGDGINDTWRIPYLDTYPGCRIDLYNRYGQKVFSSTGYMKEWDGTSNGRPLAAGTYYYIIVPGNGREQMSGSVTLLR